MADRNSLVPVHTHQELENARTRGQVVGWLQGAGAMVLLGLALKFVGWIPLILIGGVGAYFAWRLISGGGRK
jgi:hypothetical protein